MRFQIFKAGAAQGFGETGAAFRLVYFGVLQRVLGHRPHCGSGLKLRFLFHVTDPKPFAEGYFSVVRDLGAGQNSQQSGLPRAVRTDESNPISFRDGE